MNKVHNVYDSAHHIVFRLEVTPPPSPWQLYLYLKEACLPFLRCAAFFFHYLTDVRPPEELAGTCTVSTVVLQPRYPTISRYQIIQTVKRGHFCEIM